MDPVSRHNVWELMQDLKKVDAAVSSGNTGVLLMGGLLILGKIDGIRRPALAPFIPIGKKFTCTIGTRLALTISSIPVLLDKQK